MATASPLTTDKLPRRERGRGEGFPPIFALACLLGWKIGVD